MEMGFTLIELLVVVLIIGILAAVALPQYEKAVVKSRFAEAKSIISSVKPAVAACVMANAGTDPYNVAASCGINELDVNIPGSLPNSSGAFTENFIYGIYGNATEYYIHAAYQKDKVCLCYSPATNSFGLSTDANNYCGIDKTSNTDYGKILNISEMPDCECC